MQEARAIIASLRAQLSAASLTEQEEQAQEQEEVASLSEAKCDREVFEGIKARVVKEFGLGPEYVGKRLALNALFPPAETSFGSSQDQKPAAGTADVLKSAVARFPGDPDIVASANYIKYNRARQGKLHVRLHSNRSLASFLGPLSATALGAGLRLTSLELT